MFKYQLKYLFLILTRYYQVFGSILARWQSIHIYTYFILESSYLIYLISGFLADVFEGHESFGHLIPRALGSVESNAVY